MIRLLWQGCEIERQKGMAVMVLLPSISFLEDAK
jgi:hypothetical protein